MFRAPARADAPIDGRLDDFSSWFLFFLLSSFYIFCLFPQGRHPALHPVPTHVFSMTSVLSSNPDGTALLFYHYFYSCYYAVVSAALQMLIGLVFFCLHPSNQSSLSFMLTLLNLLAL